MQFDHENPIVKRCAAGMLLEGEGKYEEAKLQFESAWNDATTDFERFVAAHYVARHQVDIRSKLKWDITAFKMAERVNNESVFGAYPSLLLNIGKGYEDLGELDQAELHYKKALKHAEALDDDGYGAMIMNGIKSGLDRISSKN